MSRAGYLFTVSLVCCFAMVSMGLHYAKEGNGTISSGRLPGARPTIDASKYLTLQAAFDALPETGGLVQFPAGTFEIDEPLVLSRSDVCIQGAGTATHIKNNNTTGKPAIIVEKKGVTSSQRNEQLWRVRISNLRITGNDKSGHGIDVRWVNEIFLDGITVSHHGGDGIRLDTCYEDPRICHCLITYNKQVGLNCLGCHDIIVSANQFEENRDAVHCINGYNLTMSGNCLDDHLRHGVVIENTYGSVVAANMIEECVGTAIIMDRDCYGNTVSANVIAHNGAGVDLIDAHGCSLSANTFTIMKTNAIRIGAASGRISVGGNSFCSSYIGDGMLKRGTDDMGAAGIRLESTSEIAISGNQFSGLKPAAISLGKEPSKRIVFANNVITDSVSQHGQLKEAINSNNLESGK